MPRTWPLWFLCLALLIWDAVQLAKSTSAADEGKASLDWPTAPGTVIKSGVGTIARGRRTDYVPAVDYTYTVGTAAHTGHRVHFTAFDRRAYDDAAAIAARYPVGATVVVHYDPQQPDESVLEPGAPTVNWQRKVVGVALVALSLAAIAIVIEVLGARRRRKRLLDDA